MSLSSALSIASGSIGVINAELALVSQNVSNVGTPGYVAEAMAPVAVSAAGQGMGVRAQPATRTLDSALQASLFSQNAAVTALQTQQTALQKIDATMGTPGAGNDLSSRVGNLQDAFTSLLSDPSNATQQQNVVATAQALTGQINKLAQEVQGARQDAQDGIVADVASLNQALTTIGKLNTQIAGLKASGGSTADLENTRDAALGTVSGLVDARFLTQPNGAVLVTTAGGSTLPTDGTLPVQTSGAAMDATNLSPPPITLGGQDITASLTGGSLGARISLRDHLLPTRQAELDEFAETLVTRFSDQGLPLFTDVAGQVPVAGGTPVQAGYVGLATTIQVNPQIATTPSLVRDGTTSIAGSASGASAFVPNPTTGPAGFATMIGRVLNYALGTQIQDGVAQPTANVTGLGASGTLAATYGGDGSLSRIAGNLTTAHAQQSAAITAGLDTETAVQVSLQGQLSSASGVSVDAELSKMIALQNAYGANARIISTVQAMFSTLLQAVS